MAATMFRESIFESFMSDQRAKAFFHGHSFTGHPIGCAVALRSLELVLETNVPAKLDAIGSKIESVLAPLRESELVSDVRRRGGIVALEFATDEGGYMAKMGESIRAACRASEGVLLRPLGNIIYALPPACTTLDEAEQIANAMAAVHEHLGTLA